MTSWKMKKALLFPLFMLAVSGCRAADAPVLGVWEQLVVARADAPTNLIRRNFIFSDKKIERKTIFSAFADAFDGPICCIEVSNPMSIDLEVFLKKYDWDADDSDHLKSIKGWKYIYEASLVDSTRRNQNMRDLVRNMSSPGDVSPFSAAVISDNPVSVGTDGKRYGVNGMGLEFSSIYDKKTGVVRYVFDFSDGKVSFSEAPFPAE
jgi:hypothetical protein